MEEDLAPHYPKKPLRSPPHLGWVIAASALAVSVVVYGVTRKSETHNCPQYTSVTAQDPAVIRVAAGIHDTEKALRELYSHTDDDSLEETLQNAITITEKTYRAIQDLQNEIRPLKYVFNHLNQSGLEMSGSFIHQSQDTQKEVCTRDSEGDLDCEMVYDYTSHWWSFNPESFTLARSNFEKSRTELAQLGDLPAPIDTSSYQLPIPSEKKLSPQETRRINEWINTGLVAGYNNLYLTASLDNEPNITALRTIDDTTNNPDYKSNSRRNPVKNNCPGRSGGCNQLRAPIGYILLQQIGGTIENYASSFNPIDRILSQGNGQLIQIQAELRGIKKAVDNKKDIDRDDVRVALDLAYGLYRTMIPQTTLPPPAR